MVKNKAPQLVDHVSEASDEEIDEDLAFNSDDERMYGSLFRPKGSTRNHKHDDEYEESDDDDSFVKDGDDDDEDELESDEGIASDDDDGDGGQFMLDLLNNLDNNEKDDSEEKKEIRVALANTSKIPESEFSSTAVKSSNLTLDELMGGISDTKGFQSVKNAMRDMTSTIYENDVSSSLTTTKTPVAKIVSERAERKVHYEEQTENVSGWTHVVKTNREAETLDFRPKDRIKINKADLVQKFEPTTDFEKEIAAALEEAGEVDDKDVMAREKEEMFGEGDDDFDDDDLGRNKVSAEEYKKRLGELSKMRALMFYEEQKRHRISKIKSKKYRKIRKKQRLKSKEEEEKDAAEHDEELAREIEEKAEMERMKERMSLKHRNTSKWAKRVLQRGGTIDMETRKALSEQIRIGDELKKKMQGQFVESDNDEEIDLISQARNVLSETEQNEGDKNNKGIFKLAFMKKGIEAQRKRAKEEALELIRELEGNESGGESDANSEKEAKTNNKSTKKKIACAKEMKNILGEGKLVASSLIFGNSTSVQVSGDIDVTSKDLTSAQIKNDSDEAKKISLSKINVNIDQEAENTIASAKATIRSTTTAVSEESNPWLITEKADHNTKDNDARSIKRRKSRPSVSSQGVVNVSDAVNVITGEETDNELAVMIDRKSDIEVPSDTKIVSLNQEELVKKAFATPSEKEIEEDFENEKEKMRTRDDHSKKENESKFVSGWGAWAGEGAPIPKSPKMLPKRLAAPEKKIAKRQRQDDGKKNVIINAKRIKKTAKFQLENIPHPFTSREQYERAMTGAIGKEWNVTSAVKNMTRKDIITRAGKMIKPVSKTTKVKRNPAKLFKDKF